MSNSRKNKKKTTEYPYTELSWKLYPIVKIVTITMVTITLLSIFLGPLLSQNLHEAFDENAILQSYDNTNKASKGYFEEFVPRDVMPDTTNWAKIADDYLLVNTDGLIKWTLIIAGTLLGIYILSLLLRHRNGEMSPFFDDAKARSLKRKMITNIGARRRGINDEPDQKIKKQEHLARAQIRRGKIRIHTRYEKGAARPTKSYFVIFERAQSQTITEQMLKKIKELNDFLSAETGVNFGAMARSSNKRYYMFTASQEAKAKESMFVKLRRRKANKDGSGESVESEYAFPLTLFTDNSEKIEGKRAEAERIAESYQDSVRIYLVSEGVKVEPTDLFTGNTSVQMQFSLPSYTDSLPNLENLQQGIDASLDLQGTLVNLRGSKLNIVVPLPDGKNIPMDFKSMIEEEF